MKNSFVVSFLGLAAATSSAYAVVLTQAPSPMSQSSPAGNGMSHVNVGWDTLSSTLITHVDFAPVDLKPLSLWQPGNSFDPASPWYSLLNPNQGAGLFNSQYGLLADSTSLPESLLGSRFLVNVVSASPGLLIYQSSYMGATQTFVPILGTDGSDGSFQWTGTMTHPMFVLPAGSTGTASATLRFTLTDSSYVPLQGYATADATINFTAVPEPSTTLLGVLGITAMITRRRRHIA